MASGTVTPLRTLILAMLALSLNVGPARSTEKRGGPAVMHSRDTELAAMERLSYIALEPRPDACWGLGGTDITLVLPFNPSEQPLCEWNIDELRFGFLAPDAIPEVDLVKDPHEFNARASSFSTSSCFGTRETVRFGSLRTLAPAYEEFLRAHPGPLAKRSGQAEFMALLRKAQRPYSRAVDSLSSYVWHTVRSLPVKESNYDFSRGALVFRVFEMPMSHLMSAQAPTNWRIAEDRYPAGGAELTEEDLWIREIVIPMSAARADSFITRRRRLNVRWYFSVSGLQVACASLTNPDGTGGGGATIFYPKPRVVALEITTGGEAALFDGTVPSGQYASTRLGYAVANKIARRVESGDSLGTRRPYTLEDREVSSRRNAALQTGRPWEPLAAAADSTSTTPVQPPAADLTGTWSGPAEDNTGRGMMTFVLTTTNADLSGSVMVADEKGKVLAEGTITGQIVGNALTGSIKASAKKCTTTLTLTASINGGTLTGGYRGWSSCSSKSAINGTLTLSRK